MRLSRQVVQAADACFLLLLEERAVFALRFVDVLCVLVAGEEMADIVVVLLNEVKFLAKKTWIGIG